MKFERITNVRLPFDRRDPDPSKDYGIHGLDIWFVLKGSKGAVQFAVTFPVYLPHVEADLRSRDPIYLSRKRIMGFDVGYHAKEPQYEDQGSMPCQYLEGRCYYDGSSLRADEWAKEIFAIRGSHPEDEIWRRLEDEYKDRFGEDEAE